MKMLGTLKLGRRIVVADPGWADVRNDGNAFDDGTRENLVLSVRPGLWRVLFTWFPLTDAHDYTHLHGGDAELKEIEQRQGVQIGMIAHEACGADPKNLAVIMKEIGRINLESARVGFVDEGARRQKNFLDKWLDADPEKVFRQKAFAFDTGGDGEQKVFAYDEGLETVFVAVDLMWERVTEPAQPEKRDPFIDPDWKRYPESYRVAQMVLSAAELPFPAEISELVRRVAGFRLSNLWGFETSFRCWEGGKDLEEGKKLLTAKLKQQIKISRIRH